MNDNQETKVTKGATPITPNGCTLPRWLLVLAISLVGGLAVMLPFNSFLMNTTDSIMGITYKDFFNVLSFVPLFVAFVIGLKLVAKTSVKDFVMGVGGKIRPKFVLTIFILYVLGMALSTLIFLNNISFRGVQPGQYAFLVVFSLLFVGIQTTFEEFAFRGLILRWVCKNDIRYSKKSLLAAVVTSLAFALAHAANPEVTEQKGFDIVLTLFVYFFVGFLLFWLDIHFGSLLPGIIIHFVNNFILLTIVSQDATVITNPTLLVNATPVTPWLALLNDAVCYLPVSIFALVVFIKRKKAAPAEKQ